MHDCAIGRLPGTELMMSPVPDIFANRNLFVGDVAKITLSVTEFGYHGTDNLLASGLEELIANFPGDIQPMTRHDYMYEVWAGMATGYSLQEAHIMLHFVQACPVILSLMFVCLVVISDFVPFAMTQLHPIQIRKWAVVERKTYVSHLLTVYRRNILSPVSRALLQFYWSMGITWCHCLMM